MANVVTFTAPGEDGTPQSLPPRTLYLVVGLASAFGVIKLVGMLTGWWEIAS